MSAVVAISQDEVDSDPLAKLWALAIYLAGHPEAQVRPEFQSFWLAYSYDAQVLNGGHLQYFHNCGVERVTETQEALRAIGAHEHAALLDDCWHKIKNDPIERVSSLSEYADLAEERSFSYEDSAYYQLKPDVISRLGIHYESLFTRAVAISA